jgi:hypothetical protein
MKIKGNLQLKQKEKRKKKKDPACREGGQQ